MRHNNRLIKISLALMIGLSVSCSKGEPAASAPAPTPTSAPTGKWQTTMPAKFAGLAAADGGTCFLDGVNDAVPPTGPILVKSGSPLSLVGWAVDLKAGRLGSALGIELNAATPYFIAADSFTRPGLGTALKNPSLDGGGLKLDATPLNVPAGDYRLLFLIQSNSGLLLCDTGHALRVQ